ncbi:MAG: zf-TFIIB domain-containing protein [Deltaproteobacteria bacterium]|nr:zf-TFIIB domain-containing protein [Deltaproteobacteria bacterium]
MNCPKCASNMTKVKLDAGVEVDCCDSHGVWLDVGELQAILAHTEKRAASQGPGIGAQLGKQLVGSAVSGAGFGVGSGIASALVRSLFR